MDPTSSSASMEMKTTEMPLHTPISEPPKLPVEMETEMPLHTPISEPPQQLVELKTGMPFHTQSKSHASTSSTLQPNLPSGELFGDRNSYLQICVPLYEASVKGDLDTAIRIIREYPEVIRSSITENCDTALHVAASAKSTKQVERFVEFLLTVMEGDDLLLQNRTFNNPLSLAAAGGNVNIARILVANKRDLLDIPGNQRMLPLHIASLYGKYKMVKYLYQESNMMSSEVWTPQTRGWILSKCVEAGFFDVALRMVTDRPTLAANGDVLTILSRKTDALRDIKPDLMSIRDANLESILILVSSWALFKVLGLTGAWPIEKESDAMKLLKVCWTHIMRKSKAEVDDILRGPPENEQQDETPYSSRVLFIAAELGNTKFIVELIRQYPDLVWKVNDKKQSIFHVAVSHRHEGIYNLLYELGSMKDLVIPLRDIDGNNMLHLAAKISKTKRLQDISGVALQMQREMLWYKEVEDMLPPSYRERRNNDGLLPHELFTREHKDLVTASEKWMKDTSSQCMVVAALIATVVFAAAFTMPGGYDDNGFPIFRGQRAFIIFVISDAISLTFATISILMFLYILTSRYAEQDFLESLPKKLMRGLATLFLSIVAMMVSFSIIFFLLYKNDLIWVPNIIAIFAAIPVFLYVRLQYDLLADVYHSTYGSKKLFKPEKPILYYSNPQF